jgi:3-oxoacyl-[acyl-carrier protein] reductase
MTQPLQGRRVLVTGGATGIGAAIHRQSVGREKVSAIALAPAVQTPGADRLREFLGPEAAEFIDEQIKSTIPIGGALGDPVDDLGPTLVFLCGQGSRFITGQLIAFDGGLVMLGA